MLCTTVLMSPGGLVVIHTKGGGIKWLRMKLKINCKVREVKRVVGQKVHQDSRDNGSHKRGE